MCHVVSICAKSSDRLSWSSGTLTNTFCSVPRGVFRSFSRSEGESNMLGACSEPLPCPKAVETRHQHPRLVPLLVERTQVNVIFFRPAGFARHLGSHTHAHTKGSEWDPARVNEKIRNNNLSVCLVKICNMFWTKPSCLGSLASLSASCFGGAGGVS